MTRPPGQHVQVSRGTGARPWHRHWQAGSAETAELAELRAQLREAQETLEAIRTGSLDSLVIGPPGQEQIYSLATADRTYRLLVAAMNEGAATVSPRGVILDANPRLASMTGRAIPELVGTSVLDLAHGRAPPRPSPGCSISAPVTARAARWNWPDPTAGWSPRCWPSAGSTSTA